MRGNNDRKNWSTFEFIHSKKCNKLVCATVRNIVKVHCILYVSLTTLKRSGIAMPTSTGLLPMKTWIDWPV